MRAFVPCSFEVVQLDGDGYSRMVAEAGSSPFSLGEDVMSKPTCFANGPMCA